MSVKTRDLYATVFDCYNSSYDVWMSDLSSILFDSIIPEIRRQEVDLELEIERLESIKKKRDRLLETPSIMEVEILHLEQRLEDTKDRISEIEQDLATSRRENQCFSKILSRIKKGSYGVPQAVCVILREYE